jgi:hypothetical protein
MDYFAGFEQHLGLYALTAISVVLVYYLVYSMVHPERY